MKPIEPEQNVRKTLLVSNMKRCSVWRHIASIYNVANVQVTILAVACVYMAWVPTLDVRGTYMDAIVTSIKKLGNAFSAYELNDS
jgi:hypothetical protein